MSNMIYGDDEKDRLRKERARARRKREEEVARKQFIKITALVLSILLMTGAGIYIARDRTLKKAENLISSTENLAAQSSYAIQGEDTKEDTSSDGKEGTKKEEESADGLVKVGDAKMSPNLTASTTASTIELNENNVLSGYAVLINAATDEIVAERNANTRISPASMTKILTALVGAENMKSEDDTITMTLEITDYAYVNDCSSVGFLDGEVVPVKDLFYGTVLPSGGDAAVGLATYIAGSHEDFVDKMNDKLTDLGLNETTHFTNCVGIYNENHYSTVYDMAIIMKAAVMNDYAREVLSAHKYTTTPTTEHPDGINISNLFLRRIEDRDTGGGIVLCAKTGYVVQSGSCAASYYISDTNIPYICVTVNAASKWDCIKDHASLYKNYAN